ncbi:MAG: type II secretion system protein [Clostridia bacterium]|nr:type II secretion system protein [Clostridia bacterium]
MNQMKNTKGITLIALVITIIVLLILAGVAIVSLTGENGVLTRASDSKNKTDEEEEKEAIAIAYNGAITESKGESVTADALNSQFSQNGTSATASGEETIKVDFTKTGRSYIVNAYGKVEKFDDIANYLKVGDYVNYPDKNGNKILCKVLYNNEDYGVQLVSLNAVGSVTLGSHDPKIPSDIVSKSSLEKAKWSYNNAIKTLNDKAEEYRNPKYTDEGKARCVGSVPDAPYSEATDYFTSSYSYMSNYNGMFKNKDNNYNEDWNQLDEIGARGNVDYWLSCRSVYTSFVTTEFRIRSSDMDALGKYLLYIADQGAFADDREYSSGFRPVFRLKPNVKIDDSNGGDGKTEQTAYELK